jgi:hypothetical protein
MISGAKLSALRLGVDFATALLGYGERWRTHRRIFHDNFKKEKMVHYQGVVSEKVHLLLGELLHDPDNLEDHCKWYKFPSTLKRFRI